jgi:hypothetical protein
MAKDRVLPRAAQAPSRGLRRSRFSETFTRPGAYGATDAARLQSRGLGIIA